MKKRLYLLSIIMLVILLAGCVEIELSEVKTVTANFTPKTAYLVDEEEILNDYQINVTFTNKDPQTFTLDDTDVNLVGGFNVSGDNIVLDTASSGDKSLSISYGGVSVSLEYSVYDAIVTTTGYMLKGNTAETASDTPINSAINAVADKAWIFVESGEYNEYVTDGNRDHGIFINNQSVHLRASDYVYLEPHDESGDPKSVYSIIRVNNNGPVTIDGFILSDSWTAAGALQYNESPFYFLNNHINASETTGQGNSIQFQGSGSIVSGNTIYVSPTPTGWDGTAVLLVDWYLSTQTLIESVTISNNTIIRDSVPYSGGIAIYQTKSTTFSNINITNNVLSGGEQGAVQIQMVGGGEISGVHINNNTFTQNGYSIFLYQHTGSDRLSDFTVSNNVFSNDSGEEYVIIEASASLLDTIDFDHIMANNDWAGKTPVRFTSDGWEHDYTYLYVPGES